ncbi:MAG TPA: helicase RepA family protein [Methyloceanibacter sp.]|nr:helicase RepA family protein [Methyloceanibacter sp.]
MSKDLERRIRIKRVDDIMNMPEPKWLIEGILKENSLAVLYGAPKSTKSFVALDWAASLVEGKDWFDFTVPHQRDVIYVQAEAAWGLKARITAWQRARGGELHGLGFVDHPINMLDDGERKALSDAIKATGLQPGLIILDTLARNFGGGDENSAQHMNQFVRNVDLLKAELGSAVLIVHHSGRKRKAGPRGSTALFGALDTQILLEKRSPGRTASGGKIKAELICEAQKDAQLFERQSVTLECRESCVAVTVEELKVAAPKKAKVKSRKNRDKMLGVLSEQECTPYPDWKQRSGVPPSSFYRLRDTLVKDGAVLQDKDCFRLPPSGT